MAREDPPPSKEEIEKLANNLRSEKWGSDYPVNPFTIWEHRMGHSFDTVPGLNAICGIEAYLIPGSKVIVLDKETYMKGRSLRLNFSVAHEIGHWVLHRDFRLPYMDNTRDSLLAILMAKRNMDDFNPLQYAKVEAQANIFAAVFLMPRQEITETAMDVGRTMLQQGHVSERSEWDRDAVQAVFTAFVAERFEVTTAAMRNRLVELDVWDKLKDLP